MRIWMLEKTTNEKMEKELVDKLLILKGGKNGSHLRAYGIKSQVRWLDTSSVQSYMEIGDYLYFYTRNSTYVFKHVGNI